MKISELFNPYDLAMEMDQGFVRMRKHPDDAALFILNYTEKAQFENRWNDVTKQCRGLIARTDDTGEDADVLARPFDKFLNYGQPGAAEIPSGHLVEVTDKADGSLGILYPGPDGGWSIATRGSFESEQAIHATALWRSRYGGPFPARGWTYLFEIVYPENRIVLDYADMDDLIMLGARSIESGVLVGPQCFDWEGPRTKVFEYVDLTTALAAKPRPNAEGLVVRAIWTGAMVKIKQEDYVRLHKIVTGLSERGVWEHLSAHEGMVRDLALQVPDEFHGWITQTADALLEQFDELSGRAHEAYYEILDHLDEIGEGLTRPAFAEEAKQRGDLTPLLFLLLDGRPLDQAIWRRIKPVGHRPMTHRTEDVA